MRLGTTHRKLDRLAIEQGVEKECPERPGLFVRILPASTYNPRYRKAIQDEAMRIKDGGEADGNRYEDAQFVADVLVADMRGLYDGEEEIEYTPEIGAEIFADPAHRDVLDWIVSEAMKRGQFYTEAVEKKVGNSPAGSSGKKAGAGKSTKTRS